MFYVMKVKFLKDGSMKESPVMTYEEPNRAKAKFHKNLGEDMDDSTLKGGMCTVINSHGGQECKEYWGYTDIDPEPEPNTEGE